MRLTRIIPALYLAFGACGGKDDKPAKQEDRQQQESTDRVEISNADVEYYPVSGNSCEEAKENMTGYTIDGEWVAGKTDAEISFGCGYDPIPDPDKRCCNAVISGLTTSCNATVYLPQWNGSDKCWDRFIDALTVHEQGHVDICQDYKGQLESALSGLESRECLPKTCEDAMTDLEQKANSEFGRVSAEHNDAQDAYDTSNNHGAGQGAVLNCDCE